MLVWLNVCTWLRSNHQPLNLIGVAAMQQQMAALAGYTGCLFG